MCKPRSWSSTWHECTSIGEVRANNCSANVNLAQGIRVAAAHGETLRPQIDFLPVVEASPADPSHSGGPIEAQGMLPRCQEEGLHDVALRTEGLLARVETKHGLLGGFEYSLGWRFGRQPWNRCLQDGLTPSAHQSENRARSLGDKVGNRVGHVTVAQSSGCLRDRGWLLNLLLPLTLWFAAIFLLRSSSFRAAHPPATLASSSTPSLPAWLHGLPLALSRRMCSRVECATARTCDLQIPCRRSLASTLAFHLRGSGRNGGSGSQAAEWLPHGERHGKRVAATGV